MDTEDLLDPEALMALQVSKYRMVAVVDAGRSFANNEVSLKNTLSWQTHSPFVCLVRLCEDGKESNLSPCSRLAHVTPVRRIGLVLRSSVQDRQGHGTLTRDVQQFKQSGDQRDRLVCDL